MSKGNIHRIAVIPGDGIGKEVVPEGIRVLEAASARFGCGFEFDYFDFASCDYYLKHGRMMPEDWKQPDRRPRCDLFRRGGVAGDRTRPCFAMGIADPVPP